VKRRTEPAPRKALGQHFLRDREILGRIADAVDARDDEVVLEIGAGTGELTAELATRYRNVVAVELDERLANHTRLRFRESPNVEIVEGDARDIDLAAYIYRYPAGYRVAGNLPYFAANPIIRRFLEHPPRPNDMVVMVQREVAREIAAPPGDYSLHSISIQVYARAEILFTVPPEAFDPPPKVVSAVVRITPRNEPLVPPQHIEAFFKLVGGTFKNPRKQIHNALSQAAWMPPGAAMEALEEAGIDPMLRPERLTIPDWLRLLDACEEVRARG
jgi:16S rRNA (adenine1518-N6/adenine1519-N6)-dimethyltransferase